MKNIYKNLVIGTAVIGAAGAGAGVVAGVVIPKALKAASGLKNFISEGGSFANLKGNLAKNKKLKVVALGDSVTAGYNGYTDDTEYSYVDFLVKGLQDGVASDEKIEYKNFAQNGLKLADFSTVIGNSEVRRELATADLIPISIGANDILSVLKLFSMPFGVGKIVIAKAADILKDTTFDANGLQKAAPILQGIIDALEVGSKAKENNNNNQVRIGDTSFPLSKKEAKEMRDETIKDIEAVATGDTSKYINLDKDWVNTIFDLVKREIANLVRDVHKMAPNAQILFLGHALPFAQFPEDVLTTKNSKMNNTSLLYNFNKLLDSMEDGAKTSLGSNDFVTFYRADNLEYMKDYALKLVNGKLEKGSKYKHVNYNPDPLWNSIFTKFEMGYKEMINGAQTKDDAGYSAIITGILASIKDADEKENTEELLNYYKGLLLKFKTSPTLIGQALGKKKGEKVYPNYLTTLDDNPMSNILDIHPTIFGQSLIGRSLFKEIAQDLGWEKTKIASIEDKIKATAYDTAKDPLFEKVDENPIGELSNLSSAVGFWLLMSKVKELKGFGSDILPSFKTQIMGVKLGTDPTKFKDVMETTMKAVIDKIIEGVVKTKITDATAQTTAIAKIKGTLNALYTANPAFFAPMLAFKTSSDLLTKMDSNDAASEKDYAKVAIYNTASYIGILKSVLTIAGAAQSALIPTA